MVLTEKIVHSAAVVTIVSVDGHLLGGEDIQHLREKIKSLIERQINHIILDLDNLEYMNSLGLGAFLAILVSVKKAKGTLSLINLHDKVREIFLITKADTIFNIFASEAEALAGS
ncbi:MAG TPA: STAS domain-containing protein [Bacteroidota bacterium]|nr:STAS domain-containing protein [Bacteroidota bacterium]